MRDPTLDRFARLEDLFARALELEPSARPSWVAGECADDPALAAEVLELLEHSDGAEARLGAAVEGGLSWLGSEAPRPERIGPYRILEEIGRGGLGTVYHAERDDEFRMRVALKVVRPEIRSPELERRLRHERQILAGLDHPHIAQVFDGGTSADGAPYLVMELVDGRPIHEACADMPLRRRLELFRDVCAAVHFAHRNLVLHRDLKPSNILVTDDGRPKLLDFGIAKVLALDSARPGGETGDDETDPAPLTRPGMRLLTPEYASPEQVLDEPLTTGSDVYSLGVVLFELLAGEPPYRIESRRPTEIERVVCTEEPERPSLVARRAGRRTWGRDLDTIVATALHKDPRRRYASVEQLSEDLRRFLDARPIAARRDTFGYRLSKFVRRNRVSVAAALLIAVTLLAATVVTARQARIARAERERAERSLVIAETERERAEEVADFLVDLFEISDPNHARGATITAREVLDQGARRIRWQLRERPVLRTTLMSAIGRVYRRLGLLDDAETLLDEALTIQAGVLGAEHPNVIATRQELGVLRWEQGETGAAEEHLRRALEAEHAARGDDTPRAAEILQDLAMVVEESRDRGAARALLDRALAARLRHFGEGSIEVAETRDRLAQIHYLEADYEAAEALARRALDDRRRQLGDAHPDIARSLNNLAAVLRARGEAEAAEGLLEEALAMRRRLYGDLHGAVAQSLHNLAMARAGRGARGEARELLEEALAVYRAVYDAEHPAVAETLFGLAQLALADGEREQAEALHRRALAIRRTRLGDAHRDTAHSLYGLAHVVAVREPAAAERLYREALAIQRRVGDETGRTYTLEQLGRLVCARDPSAGAGLLREATELRRRSVGAAHWTLAWAQAQLGACLTSSEPARAADLLRDAEARLVEALGAEHPQSRQAAAWRAALGDGSVGGSTVSGSSVSGSSVSGSSEP